MQDLETTIKKLYPYFGDKETKHITKKLFKSSISSEEVLSFSPEQWFFIYVDTIFELKRLEKRYGKKN